MPLWLLKLLPYGAGALALGLAVWYIDHRGYERAVNQNKLVEAKLDLQQQVIDKKLSDELHDFDGLLQTRMNTLNGQVAEKIDGIDVTNRTIIQPTLTKEIADAPRLSDPTNALPIVLWKSINQARGLSSSSCSSGVGTADCGVVSASSSAP